MDVAAYVSMYCCVALEYHMDVFNFAMQTLLNCLLWKRFGQFVINGFRFCGSFREGTRIKQFSGGILEIEFDILALSNNLPHNIQEAPSQLFHEFVMSVQAALHPAFIRTESGHFEQVFQTHSNVKVLIDLHPAVLSHYDETGNPVYNVLLPSGWRKSYVAKEMSIICSSPRDILPFRILKYIRQLIPECAQFKKYHLKMAVQWHIRQIPPNMDHSNYRCTIEILIYLLNSYRNNFLPNIHTGQNLLQGQLKLDIDKCCHWLQYAHDVLACHFNDMQTVQNMFQTHAQAILQNYSG